MTPDDPAATSPPPDAVPSPAAPSIDSGSSPTPAGLFWRTFRMCTRIYTSIAFDLKVFDTQYVPATGGALIVSNHQSYLDPILLAVQLRRTMSYLARADLFDNPMFARIIRGLNAFPIKRGKGDKGAIEETLRRLAEGHLLNVFVEGTRTTTGEIQPLQRGIALLVRRADVPIIPAVIEGSYDAWPKGSKWPRARRIRVLYGPPLALAGLKGDAILTTIEQTLRRMHQTLRDRMREERER